MSFDFDAEERYNKIALRRHDRFFELDAQFERSGDPLLELRLVAEFVAGPDFPHERIIRRFVASVEMGAFPEPGTGFRIYGGGGTVYERRAVRDLVDLHSINPRPGGFRFAPGQYLLRPSRMTVEGVAIAMRARRSVWVRWLTALSWPIPVELQPPAAVEPTPQERLNAWALEKYAGREAPKYRGKEFAKEAREFMRAATDGMINEARKSLPNARLRGQH